MCSKLCSKFVSCVVNCELCSELCSRRVDTQIAVRVVLLTEWRRGQRVACPVTSTFLPVTSESRPGYYQSRGQRVACPVTSTFQIKRFQIKTWGNTQNYYTIAFKLPVKIVLRSKFHRATSIFLPVTSESGPVYCQSRPDYYCPVASMLLTVTSESGPGYYPSRPSHVRYVREPSTVAILSLSSDSLHTVLNHC